MKKNHGAFLKDCCEEDKSEYTRKKKKFSKTNSQLKKVEGSLCA
jgi:hypothetical protein